MILVTGATGFIGNHLVEELLRRGENVWTLNRYVSGRVLTSSRSKFCDLRDSYRVSGVIMDLQPEFIVHLAARTPVAHSYYTPQDYIENNLIGTVNLAEAAQSHDPNLKSFIFASTSETYGDQPDFPIHESAIQMPNSPYSVTKVACENYLQYMRVAYNFPVTVMRPFNTFGRRRNRHYVVESIVTQMLEGKDLELGTPHTERDFVYVDDHVHAYLLALEDERSIGKTYNICTGQAVSIQGLVEAIREVMLEEGVDWKGSVKWNTLPERPWDIQKLQGSYDRIRRDLGWEPKVSLREGLRRTIRWWHEGL